MLVWCVRLREAWPAADRAVEFLSADERQRADRFRFPGLRNDFALSRALLRILLGRYCGCAPADVAFHYGPQGKPSLHPSPIVRFNLTHSGGIAVYAFTRDCDVGIDVEQVRPMPDLEQLAKRFFSPAEYRELTDVPAAERTAAFFDCWVRKEAYVKAVGRGLSIPLDSFRVSLAAGQRPALIEVAGDPNEAQEWSLLAFSPDPGYHGAIALRQRQAVAHIANLNASAMIAAARPTG